MNRSRGSAVVVAAALFAGVLALSGFAAPIAAAQTDLDAFMQQVLARRDDNWKKLQQYILDEREEIEVRGPGRIRLWGERRFYRLLNRMLFRAAGPERRWRVFQRFYGLPEGVVRRFYAGRSTALDKARILAGKPPVPVVAALRQLRETGRGSST